MRRLSLWACLLIGCGAPRGGGGTTTPPPPEPPVVLETKTWQIAAGEVTLSIRARGVPGGPALIVIHGGPGLSHHYTEPLETLATAKLRVVTYDQRNVGKSSQAPIHAHKLEHHVADLEALRVALGVERAHLLGHSWGGLVAMAYAVAHPGNVATMTLVDSIPPTRDGWDKAGDRFDARKKALQAEGLVPPIIPPSLGPDCSPRLLALLPVYYANPKHPSTKNLGGSTCHTGILELTFLEIGKFDLGAQLAPLTVPTLIVEGAADPFGVEMADEIASAMATSKPKKVILPACGHVPWEECPAQLYPVVQSFLAEHP